MSFNRKVVTVQKGVHTEEGAGVLLKRGFGYYQVPQYDPFLLFDDFSGNDTTHYQAGFPWHPHRGIETITYILRGEVDHGDSLGHKGVIGKGCVQWMTAGRGIVHQEMPRGDQEGVLQGFQLWANLPAKDKMTEPRYRDVKPDDIPVVKTPEGHTVRVIAGTFQGVTGPVSDIFINPIYYDISLNPLQDLILSTSSDSTCFIYILEKNLTFGDGIVHEPGDVVLFGQGSQILVNSVSQEAGRFLFICGKPLGEPVAWGGPIVMNTREEVVRAFKEYDEGTFLEPEMEPPHKGL